MNSIFYKQALFKSKTTAFTTLVTLVVVLLGFPLKAKADWVRIGNGDSGPIYLNNQSVYIKNDLRTAEVRYRGFGRALFVVNCETSNYII